MDNDTVVDEFEENPTTEVQGWGSLEEHLAAMTAQEKDYHLSMFMLLRQSQKFCEWVATNFTIQNAVDDETKTIELQVVEKPLEEVQDPFLVTDETAAKLAAMLRAEFTVHNPAAAVRRFFDVLNGKDEATLITGATDADLDKELKAHKASKILLD